MYVCNIASVLCIIYILQPFLLRFGVQLGSYGMNALLLMLPGTPLTYYGEEIGMKDNSGNMQVMSDKRDPCRSPMQWSRHKNAGLTSIFFKKFL